MVRWGFWKNRTHNLARMNLGDLVVAFFSCYAVLVYLGFAGISLWLAARWYDAWQPLAVSAAAAALVYPLATRGEANPRRFRTETAAAAAPSRASR